MTLLETQGRVEVQFLAVSFCAQCTVKAVLCQRFYTIEIVRTTRLTTSVIATLDAIHTDQNIKGTGSNERSLILSFIHTSGHIWFHGRRSVNVCDLTMPVFAKFGNKINFYVYHRWCYWCCCWRCSQCTFYVFVNNV